MIARFEPREKPTTEPVISAIEKALSEKYNAGHDLLRERVTAALGCSPDLHAREE